MEYFIDKNSIRYIYPCECTQRVKTFGVLEKYIDKKYSREEMDKIIAQFIIKHPYIEGSMSLYFNIERSNGNSREYYHMLDFKNDNYKTQQRTTTEIKYEIN